jgi:hypothetical protein
VAAHQFDEHIDVIARGKHHGIGLPRKARQVGIAVLGAVAGRYGGDDDRAPGARGDQIRVALHDLDHPDAHGAQTSNTKTQGGRVRGAGGHGHLRISVAPC